MARQVAGDTVVQMYKNCISLEQKLREEMKTKNFYEVDVRTIRQNLRLAYETLLFSDYPGAQEREVEPALWKSVFYRPIEEFRRRIKAAAAAGEKGREPLHKVKIAFGKFLQDAALFYRQLACKLQTAYGSVGFTLADAHLQTQPSVPEQQYQQQDCRPSVYRCLICLGDIFRYETSVLQAHPKKDWTAAAKHYRLAMTVYPSGGNSYNQLAVLSTYNEDDLAAVYYYFRSLAVAKPFTIARENLVLLLEQIRVKYTKLPQRVQPKAQGQKLPMKSKRPVNVLMQELSVRMAHVYGILFVKVNLNNCDEVLPAAISDLNDLLGRQGALQAFLHKSPAQQGSEHVLLRLAVLSMFSVHDLTATSGDQQLRYADAMKQNVCKHVTQKVVQSVMGALAAAVAQASVTEGSQPTGKLVLPTLTILLEWWALNPAYSVPVNLPLPVGSIDTEVAARLDCVHHLTALPAALQSQLPPVNNPKGLAGGATAGAQAAQQFALTEDWQLRGFLPLHECHSKLLFEKEAVKDETSMWTRRALQALQGIASHPVLELAMAASAPITLRQLAQAWQAFKAAVDRELPCPDSQTPPAAVAGPAAAAAVSAPSVAPSVVGTAANRSQALNTQGTGMQVDASDEPEDEEVIVFQPQQGAGSHTSAAVAPTGVVSNSAALGMLHAPSSYANIAAAPAPQVSQQQQQQPLVQQPAQAGSFPSQDQASASLQLGPKHAQQQQQQLQSALQHLAQQQQAQQQQAQQQQAQQQQQPISRPAAYSTGIASLPPNLPPSSALLSPRVSAHPDPPSKTMQHPMSGVVPEPQPPPMLQQQQPGMQQQQAIGQGHNPVWPLQDRQYDAAEVQQTRQMSASVPAEAHAATGSALAPGAGNTDQLHSMGSMAFGMGTSAVGSPGFGQVMAQNPGRFLGQKPDSMSVSYGLESQAGGSLFSCNVAGLSAGSQEQGTYHPFGMMGGGNAGLLDSNLNQGAPRILNRSTSGQALGSSNPSLGHLGTQQRAPVPYPGPAPLSLNGSIGYSANLSSAGSDRASPSSVVARTNLAAQMGFGSNPSLQSLEQLQTQLPQREQLTWQQQLLAQQQQQQSYESFGNQVPHYGGFQNHHGHHLPAVPAWQHPAQSIHQMPGALGQFGQNPRPDVHPASFHPLAQAAGHGLQGSYPMQLDSFAAAGQGYANHAQPQGNSLNWQQQLQQQQVRQSSAGLQQQGPPPSVPGSVTSPSAAAADSWGWLDDFEHKQAEQMSGAAWQRPISNIPGAAAW